MRVQKLLTLTLVFLKGAESGKNTGGFYYFFNFCRLQIMFQFKQFKTDIEELRGVFYIECETSSNSFN